MLVQAGWIQVPKVAFSNTVPEAARKSLMSMIKKMQLYHCEEEQEATHVLHGPLHQYEPGEEEWFRTLEKRDHNVLVHWWYYPDSYDSWLPQTDQFADPEEPPVHQGAWHIATRWLQDSVLFNELMNEEDYEELDEDEEEEEEEDDAAASTTARQTPASEDNNPPISVKIEQPAQVPAPSLPVLNPGHQPLYVFVILKRNVHNLAVDKGKTNLSLTAMVISPTSLDIQHLISSFHRKNLLQKDKKLMIQILIQ